MNPTDKRDRFEEGIFSYRPGKDGKVFINWYGKQVMILKGKQAQKFMSKVANLEGREAQLLMAKITGNFKRGNERQPQKGDRR